MLKDVFPGLLKNPESATDEGGNEITMDHQCGEGQWVTAQTQASDIHTLILDTIKNAAEKTFLDMQPSGPLLRYHMIKQGPSEPFVQFVERLTIAIEQQVVKEYAREDVLEKMVFSSTDEQCRTTVLTLSWEPPLSLHQMLQVCRTKVLLMGPPLGQRMKIPPPLLKATAAEAPMDTPPIPLASCNPAQRRHSFRGELDQPCYLCGKTGHWQCPVKRDFDMFRNQGKGGKDRPEGSRGTNQKN